jgi:hypothetical protein
MMETQKEQVDFYVRDNAQKVGCKKSGDELEVQHAEYIADEKAKLGPGVFDTLVTCDFEGRLPQTSDRVSSRNTIDKSPDKSPTDKSPTDSASTSTSNSPEKASEPCEPAVELSLNDPNKS